MTFQTSEESMGWLYSLRSTPWWAVISESCDCYNKSLSMWWLNETDLLSQRSGGWTSVTHFLSVRVGWAEGPVEDVGEILFLSFPFLVVTSFPGFVVASLQSCSVFTWLSPLCGKLSLVSIARTVQWGSCGPQLTWDNLPMSRSLT